MDLNKYNLTDNDNSNFDFVKYQGTSKLLLVFFRGAWCNHCKKQLQDLQKLKSDFDKLNIRIVSISGDSKLKSSLLKTFLELDFPVLSDEKLEVINDFKLKELKEEQEVSKPAVFLFNNKQEILYQYIGEDYDENLEAKTILSNVK